MAGPARRGATFLAAAVAVVAAALAGAAGCGAASAQSDSTAPRAGLVVSFSDGTTRSFCVPLDRPGLTGVDLLERAGLDARVEVSANGTAVCSIDGDGCPEPEPCWCRCGSVGGPCAYWSYQILDAPSGKWTYAEVGAAQRVLADGDVDGWAWGQGSADAGPEPPVMTFEEICAAAPDGSATETPTTATAPGVATSVRTALPGILVLGAVIVGLAGAGVWLQRR
jgi:hypothetical protein